MSQRPTHVLLVDDDSDLLDVMTFALSRAGYRVTSAHDGQQALAQWRAEQPDLVLLDGNLPKIDGFEVCRQIRQESDTPIIMLTGRREEAEVLEGLRIGADDYVTKPFSPRQLVARIEAVLRRYRRRAHEPTGEIRVGDLALDPETHTTSKGGRLVTLTRLEFRLLEMLARNAGRVVPYDRLLEYAGISAGHLTDAAGSTLLRTHVSHLRAKLGMRATGSGAPGDIRSVSGVGYTLTRSAPGTPAPESA